MKISMLIPFIAVAAAVAPPSAQATHDGRPPFQMPVPCGQTWKASTYDGHWPDQDAIDLTRWDSLDANISDGEPALASADGVVSSVFTDAGSGAVFVILDHGGGWQTAYVHLESVPPLTVGQAVAQGEQIGRNGSSGAANAHLHYAQMIPDGDDVQGVRAEFNNESILTHAGAPGSWNTWPGGEALTSYNCPDDQFLQFTDVGQKYHLLYKPRTGTVKINRLDPDGTGVTTVDEEQWSVRWTHLVPFRLFTGHPHLFSYKSSTGEVRFARIEGGGEGTTTLSSGYWTPGWTHFVPFSIGGDPYFIAYNSLTGAARIRSIHGDGTGSAQVYSSTWSKGWTHLTRFDHGGKQYVLFYKGGTGEVEIDEITGDGADVALSEVWSGTWTTGWSHLVALKHNGSSRLFGYKTTTGRARYMRFKSGAQGVDVLGTATWTKRWTAFSPVGIDGDAHLFMYKGGAGSVQMRRFNLAGDASSSIWTGAWTTGWS